MCYFIVLMSSRGVTIHLLHRCIDLYSYDPTTSICARRVGLLDNIYRSNIVLKCNKSIVSILGNNPLDLSTSDFICRGAHNWYADTQARQKSGMRNATCVTTRLCVLDRSSHLTLHMTCCLSTTVRDVQKATDIKQLLWRFATYKETPTGARAEENTFFGKVA